MAGSQADRIAHLDGWRALAIGCVLVAHFGRGFGGWLGDYGVELFFGLSGLLMAEILFVRQTELGPFLVRRLTRVFPALLVFATAMGLASMAGTFAGVLPQAMQLTLGQYLSSLFFVTNYYYAATGNHSVLGHTWSLGVELCSYALLAAIAATIGRQTRVVVPVLLAICVASWALGAWLMTQPNFGWESVYWRTDARLPSIILAAAAFLVLRGRKVPPFAAPMFLVVSAVIFAYGGVVFRHIVGTIAMALAIGTLEASYLGFRRMLATPVLTFVGTISYSLYLWQQPFWKAADKGPPWLSAVALIPALIAAYVSYRLIEGPSRDWLNHRLLKRKAIHSDVREADMASRTPPAAQS